MTIHKCDPLRYEPWYLSENHQRLSCDTEENGALGYMWGIEL